MSYWHGVNIEKKNVLALYTQGSSFTKQRQMHMSDAFFSLSSGNQNKWLNTYSLNYSQTPIRFKERYFKNY